VICALSIFGDFHFNHPLDGKRSLSNASTAIENQSFGAGVTKIILLTIGRYYIGTDVAGIIEGEDFLKYV